MTNAVSAQAKPAEVTRHPLREPAFRALWSANVISNIGVWMQTVGGAWLMTTLDPAFVNRRLDEAARAK